MGEDVWTERYDLHSHSTNSDGQHSVADVARRMSNSGVTCWSLTDHDTISGWAAGFQAAQQTGIRFIPGVEITCKPGLKAVDAELRLRSKERASASWHLLAYFPKGELGSSEISQFKQWLTPLGDDRVPRMLEMIERLNELGLVVEKEKVLDRAGDSVGRPHLADELVALGYVEHRQQAFDEWIGDGKPAHVARPLPSIEEATRIVRACGGFTSLAHPLYYGIPPQMLAAFCKQAGVDAIECFHRSHSDAYRFALWTASKAAGLCITCGSDFHGIDFNQAPGRMAVPFASLPDVLTTESTHFE